MTMTQAGIAFTRVHSLEDSLRMKSGERCPAPAGLEERCEHRALLLDAAARLEHLARRLRRDQDYLTEWTIRSVAWDLILQAHSPPTERGARERERIDAWAGAS